MAPKNAATLVADAHLRTGKILSAMGKHDESIEHLRAAAMYGPLKMAGMPQIGNAQGDTNFSGIAGAPAAEAQLYLAKELVAKGDVQGAQEVLWEVGRDLPDHLRKDLNDLNMAMARMPRPQAPDPYADTGEDHRQAMLRGQLDRDRLREERDRYAEQQAQEDRDRAREGRDQRAALQEQRERDRVRQSLRQLTPITTIVPGLVGTWEMQPDNQSIPKRTLTIQNDSTYILTSSNDGSTIHGTMYMQGRQRTRRSRSEPASGEMMLYHEATGQIGAMSFEFIGDGVMEVIGMTGTKYATRRQR